MPHQRSYESESITVHWDSARCIHTGICLRGLPEVFDTSRRPWVEIDAADADRIAETVERCPTGALRYERRDGRPDEEPDRPTTVMAFEDGPLLMVGDLLVEGPDGEEITHESRLTLCRCGKTRNQPFCDNSHRRRGWSSGPSANPPATELPEPRAGAAEEPTRVIAMRDGSLELRGDVELFGSGEEPLAHAGKLRLCRCGQSRNKPFCDSSHEAGEFKSRDPETTPDRLEAETPAAFTPNPGAPDPREAAGEE